MTEDKKTNLSANLVSLNNKIDGICNNLGRARSDILLLAVSKHHSQEAINYAYDLGLRHFGENYLQEALTKIDHLPNDIIWHFIGHIQSNKTASIAQYFSWIHTVDRLKVLKRLSKQRPYNLPPLNICFEINVNQESNKQGFNLTDINEIEACIKYAKTAPNIKLRGLMCIPELTDDKNKQLENFDKVQKLFDKLNQSYHLEMDTLSMGTSIDLESAIRKGSTIIRIGRAIFGMRQ